MGGSDGLTPAPERRRRQRMCAYLNHLFGALMIDFQPLDFCLHSIILLHLVLQGIVTFTVGLCCLLDLQLERRYLVSHNAKGRFGEIWCFCRLRDTMGMLCLRRCKDACLTRH